MYECVPVCVVFVACCVWVDLRVCNQIHLQKDVPERPYYGYEYGRKTFSFFYELYCNS